MDHLPLPDNVEAHLDIPFLFGLPYDNGGFFDYPLRQGWNVDRLRRGDIPGARTEWNDYSQALLGHRSDVATLSGANLVELLIGPFVQNWLLYGIFQMALQRDIAPQEAICEEINANAGLKNVLMTQNLFRELISRHASLAAADSSWLTNLVSCLRLAAWVLQDLDQLSDELGGFVIPGPTHLALSSLVQTIDEYLVLWFNPVVTQATASINRARWLEQCLHEKGWCISRISMVKTELGIGGLYYASITPPFPTDTSWGIAHHDDCTASVCVAYNLPHDSKYVQSHQSEFCPCSNSRCQHTNSQCPCVAACDQTDLGDVTSELVLRGDVPLISVKKVGNRMTFDVVSAQNGARYVAISHVWSDGRGNPRVNMMPSCQGEYINACIQKVWNIYTTRSKVERHEEQPAWFWIDTLCVPVTSRSARDAAIMTMHEIYSNAAIVLVLATELTECALPASTDDALIRIVQSKWMTRLWTMQEGVLAKKLLFQFRDKVVSHSDLDDQHAQVFLNATNLSHVLGAKANLMIRSALSFCTPEAGPAERLMELWYTIRHRTTSRSSDQAVCGGILCKVDLGPILAASQDADSRMLAFWQQFVRIPLTVLWTNGPRFQIPTMRWAPQSLLDPRTYAIPLSRSTRSARVTPDGLCFSGVEAVAFPDIAVPAQDDSLIEFHAPSHTTAFHAILARNVGNASWQDLAASWTNVALLWDKESQGHDFFGGILVSMATPHRCDEVSMAGTPGRNRRIDASWLAQITVFPAGGEWDEMFKHLPTRFSDTGSPVREALDIVVHSAQVQAIDKEQEWCLS